MSYRLIQDETALERASRELASVPRLALDCEAAGFHRFTDRLSLVQLSTLETTLLLDPLSVDSTPLLGPLLEDPEVRVVMHGADYDLRLLDRDLGLRIRGLFDTQAAASLLGEEALGLASLLEKYLGVRLAKEHQRADWARRPLSPELLEYAASDTRYLLELQDRLAEELERRGRMPWAHEEFQTLEEVRWEEDRTDPVTRVKGARELSAREVTALRRAMEWRDEIARERDRAPFRVMGNKVLLEVVARRPATPKELEEMKGVSARLARQKGQELLARLRAVDTLPEDALEPYPPWQGNGGGRPTPEEQTLMDRIRDLRTERSRELGLDRGVLLTNAQILDIVRSAPPSLQDLEALPGVKRWQTEVLGPEILGILGSGT